MRITNDPDGNLYSIGTFTGAIPFVFNGGGTSYTSKGGTDIGLFMLDSTGGYRQSFQIGDSINDQAIAICSDTFGDLVICGTGNGTLNFGNSVDLLLDNSDPFITKYGRGPLTTNPIDAEPNEEIRIYPNPTGRILCLESGHSIDLVEIYTVDGRLVERIYNPGNTMDISGLPNGTYLLQMLVDQEWKSVKVVRV